MQTWFYQEQIRRFLFQITRVFSHFQVKFGTGTETMLYQVPCRYGDASRQVQNILKNNSENGINPTPQITFYITSLKYARNRVQDPTFVDTINVRSKAIDSQTGQYINQQGNAYTIKRLMPVPYDMTIRVDIWTSNTDQKLQLFEQICPLFNPALEIQSTDNFLDWGSLSYIEQQDITWSSRAIPTGTDDAIDIYSMDFLVPIWLSVPAQVTKLGVVQKIIASIFDTTGIDYPISDFVAQDDLLMGTRQAITFENLGIFVNDGQIRILKNNIVKNGIAETPSVTGDFAYNWPTVLDKYGSIKDGVSQIRLTYDDVGHEIVGTIVVNPSDSRFLVFNVDTQTIPANTMTAVNAIINPETAIPGSGLPAAVSGQRYLLITDASPSVWNLIGTAQANDIIQFNGTNWTRVFDSSSINTVQYVTNIYTGKQYKWDGSKWSKSWEGEYTPMNWRLVI